MNTTKTVVENFYKALYTKSGWEDQITDEVSTEGPFASHIKGKEEFIKAKGKFLQNLYQGEVRSIIVDGDSACVLTNNKIGHPDMGILELNACEIVKVKEGKVDAMETYFDSHKLSVFMEKTN